MVHDRKGHYILNHDDFDRLVEDLESDRPASEKVKAARQKFTDLYPKWKCPVCNDWFHMPYKYCKCENKAGG